MQTKEQAKKLRDFPRPVLNALLATLEEKCPVPDTMKPILTESDRWELAKAQGRHSVFVDVRGVLSVKDKSKKPSEEGVP